MPVRIDDVQRLVFFLTEPTQFVENELEQTSKSRADVDEARGERFLPGFR